jgi:hypothetical protein
MRLKFVLSVFVIILAGCQAQVREASLPGKPAGGRMVAGGQWQPVPKEGFQTWDIHSSDRQVVVTVARPVTDRASQFAAASQILLHFAASGRPDIVYSWGPDGPHAAAYPIFTEVHAVAANRYLLLGWIGNSTADCILEAWLIRTDAKDATVQKVSYEDLSGNHRFVLAPGRLGLFLADDGHFLGASVFGREMDLAALQRDSRPAPSHAGHWYTRGGLLDQDPGPGRVYWIDLDK